MPSKQPWNPILNPGRNVMAVWPDAWDSADNVRWQDALHWKHVVGPRANVRTDTGYDEHVLNFGFNSLFEFTPSRAEGEVLFFDVRNSPTAAQADTCTPVDEELLQSTPPRHHPTPTCQLCLLQVVVCVGEM